jgi:hypothetical protein
MGGGDRKNLMRISRGGRGSGRNNSRGGANDSHASNHNNNDSSCFEDTRDFFDGGGDRSGGRSGSDASTREGMAGGADDTFRSSSSSGSGRSNPNDSRNSNRARFSENSFDDRPSQRQPQRQQNASLGVSMESMSQHSLHKSRAMHDHAEEPMPDEDKAQYERELGQMSKYRQTWKKLQEERSQIDCKQQPWVKPHKTRGEFVDHSINDLTINPTKVRDNRGIVPPSCADEIEQTGHGAYGEMVPVMQLRHHKRAIPQPISHASALQYLPDHL